MAVADISSLWTSSIYAPKSQVDNNGLTGAEVTKKNSNRDTLRYDLCCCQDNHFCLLQDNEVCPVTSRVPGHTPLFSKGKIQYPVILHHRCCSSYCKTLLQPTRYYSIMPQWHIAVAIYITSTPTSSKHHSTASYRSITHTVSLTRYPTQHQ